MATPLIDHLLRAGPRIEPHPDLATHNSRLIEAHTLLYLSIASTIERDFGQPVVWSASAPLPYPNNPLPTSEHFTLATAPYRPTPDGSQPWMHICYRLDASGVVILSGSHVPAGEDDTPQLSALQTPDAAPTEGPTS